MLRLAALLSMVIALAVAGCHAKPPVDVQGLTAQGTVSHRFVRSDRVTPIAARLVIEARGGEQGGRPPVNLALVVDTSGSMEGKAIEDARAASKALVSALRPKDVIAVIAFGSTTEVILPSTRIEDADVAKLHQRIDAMKAIGTTDMSGGMRAAMAEVQRNFVADGVNRVILLGDGDPNEAASVKQIAADAGARGISITALGLGPDYNETLMGEVAQVSGGRFHYVADSTKVAEFFDGEIVRLNRTYAKNATLELVAGPGVELTRVIGRSGGGRRISVPIGDLSFGEKREIVVKLDAPPHRAGAAVELLDAVLRFEDVRAGVMVERRVFFGAHATDQDGELASGHDESVDRAVARAEDAAATLQAIEDARRGALEKAQKSLESTPSPSPATFSPDTAELVRALPSLAPAQQGKPVSPRDAEVVRRAHNKAIDVLQAH